VLQRRPGLLRIDGYIDRKSGGISHIRSSVIGVMFLTGTNVPRHGTQEDRMINTTQTSRFITRDNVKYAHTKGVSQNCRSARFIPAFRDSVTGEVCLSRFEDGSTAPVHMLDGMPDHWVIKRDEDNHVVRIKGSIIAGFIRDGKFYSREEMEATSRRRTGVRSQPTQVSKLPQLSTVYKYSYPFSTILPAA